MGKRKITCNNSSCKHHTNGGCDTCITLDGSGKCKSFEKGFAYYFHIVWDALDNKNFIDMVEIRMNPDLKTGLFYVMECYDLGFSEMEWGTCRMVMLKDGKEGKPLKYEEIIEREMNMEKFSKHLENFNNGIMPQMQQEQDAAGQQDKEEELMEHVWDASVDSFSGAIRVNMSSLRRKLKAVLGHDVIMNKVGEWYKIREESDR